MTKVEYYTKNKKVYHYEPTEAEAQMLSKQRKKMLFARRKADEEADEQYHIDHSKGYCTKCFMLRPLTGICPNCD